jgi:hypothetical protein
MNWKYRAEIFYVQSGWEGGELEGLSLAEGLNLIGSDGWELATSQFQAGPPEAHTEYVFKKPTS